MNNIQTISYPSKFTCNIATVNFSDYLITQGNYNLLSNIPWNYSANNSITTFSNIGIGKINPSSALDLTGTLSCQKLFINDSNIFDIYNSNVNIESYSIQTNGILSNNYYFYSNDGFINFPKPTSASILLVGAGGRGGGFILNDSNIYSNNNSNIIIPKNSKYQINSEKILNIEDGIFNIIFNNGSIILNNISDTKYKILNNATPIAWYKFDNLNNLGLDSINTYNLTNNNSVSTSINSIYGSYSASFNGTNQYLSLTNNLGLNSTNFTISFWVYRFNNNRQESIIQLGSLTNLGQRLIILYTTGNFMEFGLYGKENRTIAYANDAFNWVHWTFCYNFTNRTIQVYRNGISVYFDQTVNNLIFFDNTFYIGTNNQAGISNFNGLLDDLRIYNVELTETQVQELYNISNSYQQKNKNYLIIKNNNPIAWYKFDDQNNLGFDTQGNYHLTNNSTTLASINSVFGDYSSYYYGSGQNLSTNNNLGLNNTDFTISFWVYRLLNDRQESILQIGTISNNGQRLIILYTTGNLMEFGLFGKYNQTIAYPTDANKWIHWVFSYNYTNRTIQIYRNGSSVYFDTTVNVAINFDNNFFIGTNNQSGINSFYGLIDDLRIYRRQLWDYEIQGLYNVSTPTTIIQNTNSSYFITKDNSYPILKDLNDSIINPVFWYKFNDSSLLMLNDNGTSNVNLINSGSTFDSSNYIKGNGSISFVASSSQFATISNNNIDLNNINITNGISFSLWIRMTTSTGIWGRVFEFGTTLSSGNGSSRSIMINRSSTTTNLELGIFSPTTDGNVHDGTSTTLSIYYDNGVIDNTWKHYVWTISKTGIWNIYRNGETILLNSQRLVIPPFTLANRAYFFGKSKASGDGFYDGNIDDFRIYNFELSPSQVQELYRGKVTIISPIFNNFGGGGAGEIIYYQNYNFNKGFYNIKIGKDSVTPILRDTYIYDSNLNGVIAKGGNDGEPSFNYIDSSIISIYNKNFKFGTYYNVNNTTYKYLSPGSYDFIFNQGTLIINNTFDRSYPNLLDSSSNIIKPLLWYKFNNSSNFTNDEYYSSNNLWTSNCTFSSDYFIKGSGSLAFNAEYSQFARVPHNINLNTVNTTTGISFSVWARFSTRAYSWSRIFDFGFPDSANPQISNNFIFIGIIGTGQNLRFQIYNQGTGNTYDHSTANFRDGNWHHYTWTISTTGVWNIYIDGEVILSNSARIVIPVFTAGSQFYYLGKSLQQDNYLDGNIDDFRIYNKVLSQAEVTKLYKGECKIITFNNNLITSTTTLSDTYISPEFVILRDNDNKFINPIRWYKFDVNGLLLDSSGNNITASLNGTNASTILTLDTTNFIKGNASLNNTSVNTCYYKFALTKQPPISFCYWIRFNSFSSWCVFSYNSDNNISSLQMDISNLSSTTGFFYIYTALPTRWNVQVSGYSYQLYVNKWYFVSLTYGLNTTGSIVKLYINGNLIGTGTGVVGAEFPNIGTIYLGKSGDSGRGFDGKMDDVRVYDFELSDKQINGLYYGNNYKINSNTLIKFNEESENYILRNNYNIINSNGNYAIGTYIQNIDRSYPILYDSNNQILNPVLWYKFENSTNFESDSLNNPFNKLYNSKCIFHTSDYVKGSGSIYFDSSLYANLRIPNVIDMNAINKNKGISFSFWVKLNSSTTNWGRIFDFGQVYTTNSEVPSNYIRIAREGTSGNLNFRITRAPLNSDYGNLSYPYAFNEIYLRNFNYFDGVWRHFIWSISPTGEWSIYVNGIMVYNINNQIIIPYFNSLYQYNYIGKTFERNQNANYYLNGYLDDFRIYDFVLTSNQVIELYNGNIKFTNTDARNNAGKFLDDFNYNYAITSNTSNLNIPIKTSLVINNTDLITLTSNNYTINFNQGLTTVNNINLTSTYHILKNQESIILNPLVWYKFDDNSTQMLLDNSGNNYNLINLGATFDSNNFIKGNGSVSFSASVTQYIRVPDNFLSLIPIILNQQGISFTWWGRFGLGANYFERIFELGSMVSGSTTTTKASILCYKSGSSTDIAFMVYQKTPLISFSYTTSGINFFNNTWNHFVWTISNNGIWNIYVNGKAILINSANTNFPTNAFEGGDLLGFIGKAIHETYRLEGNIDDFRIYNFVLNATQVQEIYNNSSYAILKTTTTTNLNPLVWYKFDDNSTQMLLDNSGNNYNLNNFGATFDSNNFIKGNGSIRFLTANSQYISIPFIPFQNYYANGFTISFWFRLSASVNAYFRLISFFANGRGNNNNYIAIITTPNQTSLYIEMGTTGTATIAANPTLNVWHHITWSIKNQTWISYYDGVLAFSGIKTGTYPTYTVASSENLIGLGYVSGSYTEYYTGNIDDFRIYDFELNANQIREIYNNGVNIYTNSTYPILKNGDLIDVNPTVWYKFDNYTNLGNDSSPNNVSLFNVSNVITSNDIIKGNYSARFNSNNYLNYNSNIVNSNGIVSFNSNYAYVIYPNDGSITFNQDTICDVMLVGAGGRGGGNPNMDITLYQTTSNLIINDQAIIDINDGEYSNIPMGNYDFIFNNGIINVNKRIDRNYPQIKSGIIRQYPPKGYDSYSTEIAATISGNVSCRRTDITLTTTGITYGSGIYEIYSTPYSDNQGSEYTFNVFNADTGNAAGGLFEMGGYSTSTNFYVGSKYLVEDYKGSFIVIKLPVSIVLQNYKIFQRTDANRRRPNNFNLYGSTNGQTWTLLDSNINAAYPSNVFQKFLTTNNTYFNYYGIVVNKIYGTDGGVADTVTNFTEWQLFGYEDSLKDTTDPVLWYKFDDSTNIGKDELNKYNLTNTNCTLNNSTFIKGSSSVSFNGSSSYLTNTSFSSILSNKSFTISYFQYALSTTNGSSIQIGATTLNTGYWVGYGINNASQYGFSTWGDGMYSGNYTDTNQWVHVCFTYNSFTQERNIYRNGILITTGTLASSTITNNILYIGTLTTTTYMMNGLIDDFRIYAGVVLNQTQINQLYNNSTYYSNLTDKSYPILRNITNNFEIIPLVWYQFDNSTNIGYDSTGNHNLTNNGTITLNISDFIKGNASMSLNGTTQYLNKTGGFNFNNKNWTVSCWIKKTANGRSDGLFQFGDGTGQGAYVGIYYKSTNAISITFFNDDVDSANTYSDAGNWVHILLTYNYLTKIRRLYRNGIQIINNVSAVIPNTNTNIRIGILGSFYFQGLIDDFRFYDIELNVSQILELYNGRINITYPKLNYGSGAGGGGQITTINNYKFTPGTYNINIGIDSDNSINRNTKIKDTSYNDLIIATGGGDGGFYSLERRYPPKTYDAISSKFPIQSAFNTCNCFRCDLFISPSNVSYGGGTYETYFSSYGSLNNAARNPVLLFDSITNYSDLGNTPHFANNFATNGNFLYTSNLVESTYNGEWILIKLPTPIILKSYTFYSRSSFISRAPKTYKIYGSTNGKNWATIDNVTNLTSQYYFDNYLNYTKYLHSNINKYQYYCLTVNQILGSGQLLNFLEWELKGIEDLSTLPTLNGGINGYNLTSNHRRYPPKPYTSTTLGANETTRTLNGLSVYGANITLDNSNITYGSGIYEINYNGVGYTNVTTNNQSPLNVFNYSNSSFGTFRFNTYNTTTGYFSGNVNNLNEYLFENSYKGSWISIKLPKPIILTQYEIYPRTTNLNRCPKNFKIYGSNSAVTNSWSVIDNVNQSSSSIYVPFYQKILTNNITYYDNYCLTVNQIFTGETVLLFDELILYGIEDIINITSSNLINSNGSDGNSGIISTIGSNIESFSGNNLILSEKGFINQNLKNSSSFNFPTITGTYNTSYISSSNFIVMFTSGSDNTITINNNCTVDILLVGGGGGAGYDISGGGGSGAVLLTSNLIITPGTYSITVGSGGIGSSSSTITGANGGNSTITINGITYIALGGGGGGSRISSGTGNSGVDGGSGGGAAHSDSGAVNDGGLSIKYNYTGWVSYGNSGGFGKDDYGTGYGSGGGGGAGSAGGNASGSVAGNGGTAINLSSLFGANVGHNGWFAGGGGGCSYLTGTDGYGNGGYGLLGGGGNAGVTGSDGLVNTGGGGGGSRFQTKGGNGGSGVVIIKFNINNFTLPIQTLSKNLSFNMPSIFGNYLTSYINSDNFYVMFTSGSNNLISIPNTCKADILVVGGGGSGGPQIGGGGGGGAVVYVQNGTILSGNYSVTIGNGGNAVSTSGIGNKGNNSLFAGIIAEGGGPGNSYPYNGGIGGSGGGSGGDEIGVAEPFGGSRGTESSLGNFSGFIYGNRGGNGLERTGNGGLGGYLGGGGGGGAGEIGLNGNPNYNGAGGRGGNGVIINIIGSNVYWGAGGGGAQYSSSDSGVISRAGNGGLGGGGGGASASGYGGFAGIGGINNGGNANSQIGGSGGTNTGSGGGGGGWFGNGPTGGAGGSGVVIIKFNINDFMLPIPVFNKTLSRNMPSIFGNYFASYANSSNFYVMFTNGSNVLSLPNSYTTDILVIGGGGAGGGDIGGGGGAGGVVYQKSILLQSGIYMINVGNGGIGTTRSATATPNRNDGQNGNDSFIQINNNDLVINGITYRGIGGGGGGNYNEGAGVYATIGKNGGSGGGGGGDETGGGANGNGTRAGGSSTQGNTYFNGTITTVGGNSANTANTSLLYVGGGGGGAGGQPTSTKNGGTGVQIDITGINQWYAAGGGGGSISVIYGIGGNGIGGDGYQANPALISVRHSGTDGTGSGGGGGGYNYTANDNNSGGSGGSGIVIIRFNINEFAIPIFERNFLLNISSRLSGNYLTSYVNNSNFYVMFTSGSNNSITIPNNCTADIFLIGGGGGGGYDRGGGGGAGSAIIAVNQTLNPGIYSITVGSGGTGGSSYTPPPNGSDSEINLNGITIYRAKGGGVGGAGNSYPTSGGCGGGAGSQAVSSGGSVVYTNIVNRFTVNPNNSSSNYVVYGNKGGDNLTAWTGANLSAMDGAGGGGIGAIGEYSQKTANSPGKGGNGLEKAIINNIEYNLKNYFSPNTPFGVQSGSLFYIGGGGGGGNCVVGPGGATGGLGGGGNGAEQGNNGNAAIANTGSGGGGAGQGTYSGGAGGSGLVIIRLNINDFTLPLFAKSYGFGGFNNGGIGTNGLVIIKTPIPNPNFYFIPTNFTISLWIKLNYNANIKTIFSAKNFKDHNAGYELNVNNTNLEFAVSTSNYLIKTNFISNTSSTWQHLVFTYDNSNRFLKCYINGVDTNTSGFSIIAIRQFITDNYIIRLGGGQINGTNIYNLPDGSLIDDFRIYDFILTPIQVQELYNGKVNIYYTTYGNSKGFDAPTSNINLFNLTLGAGGSGANSNSLPLIKNNYGIGGDGNNGNAGNGLVIIKINETIEEPKEFKGYVNWNNVININNIASNNLITVNENKQIKLNYNSNVFYLDNYNKLNISNITFSNNDIIYSGSAKITNNIYSFSNLFSNIPVKQINNQIAVGIGITNPQSKLHLGYSSYSNSDILIKFTDNSTGHTIDNGMTLEKDNTSAGILWNLQNSNIILQTNNSEIMRITSNGNIGVGIQNPTSILEINSFITVKRYDYRRSTSAAPTTAGNFAVCYTTLLTNNNMSPSIITYTTNSGTGDTITINRKGIYIINAMVGNSYSGGFLIWLDKNEASNNGYGNQNLLAWTSIGNYNHSSLVYTGLLNVNDVIRVKSSNIATFTASANHTLTITLLSGII